MGSRLEQLNLSGLLKENKTIKDTECDRQDRLVR